MRIKPIDKSSMTDTIRRQLVDLIADQYTEGIYKLPTEQQIADQLQVSRNTLRSVLSQMAAEGLILRKHGMGTFINPEALAVCVNLQELIDFSGIIARCGHAPSHEIYSLTEVTADTEVAEKLRIPLGSPVLRVEYWLYADGLPAIVVEGWCSADLFFEKPEKQLWENLSAFQILDRCAGRKVQSDRVRVETMTTDSLHKQLGHPTKLRCQSVLLLDSIGFDSQEIPVIWGRAYFDTNLIHFDLYRVDRSEA